MKRQVVARNSEIFGLDLRDEHRKKHHQHGKQCETNGAVKQAKPVGLRLISGSA